MNNPRGEEFKFLLSTFFFDLILNKENQELKIVHKTSLSIE